MEQILATLVFLITKDRVYMVKKTQKIGIGRYTGTGGKVKKGETIEESAHRETSEEIGVRVEKLRRVAIIGFKNQDTTMFKVHVFFAESWSGVLKPNETEVTEGRWFPISQIAEVDMMGADYIWLPPVLKGKTIVGCFSYLDSEQKHISHRSWIKEVENLDEL
ncbi:MAG: 8-oxo-dGTP diphosphatase / 2-hydroxy-dATP diphosphatase [Patescibacteria group bacterium]|nr:8-oxo-dGTP diphosphatase / 2-hydroxy-dATP diphosphatase [Patescibacteria group bacterium]